MILRGKLKLITLLTTGFLMLVFNVLTKAQTPVPLASQPGFTYTEDFSDIANWTNGFASGIGANRFGVVPVNATGTIPDGVRTTVSSATFTTTTSGGVQRGTSQTPATTSIVLLTTGATDNTSAVAFDFFVDFTGVNAGNLIFDYATVFNQTGNRNATLIVYGSVDGTTFTAIPGAQVTVTNNVASSGTITVQLPVIFSNNPNARLRFYEYNGTGGTTGSRPKISIDNLTVTGVTIPTAAGTNAGGRVTEANGRGIYRALVMMTDSQGNQRVVYTNQQGYYTFENVPGGQVYVFSVTHRRYMFDQPNQVQFIGEETDGINFTGTTNGFFSRDPLDLPVKGVK